MALGVFLFRVDFRERLLITRHDENRIIAKAAIPAGRPNDVAIANALINRVRAVRKRQAKRAAKPLI